MSAGLSCRVPREHRTQWRVRTRKANYSTFNGRHYIPSAYSEIIYPPCLADPTAPGGRWRTKAAYVDQLPNEEEVSPA